MGKIINGKKIKLIQGDLTELKVGAIVNAANAQLVLGGGVAGAIRSKGGPTIQQECNRIGGTTVGQAVITGAGDLRCKYVIHAVGPRHGEDNEDQKLHLATLNSLKMATENNLQSIAFPAISTGIFGFPKDDCAKIMLRTSIEFLEKEETSLEEIIFCLWSDEDLKVFTEELRKFL